MPAPRQLLPSNDIDKPHLCASVKAVFITASLLLRICKLMVKHSLVRLQPGAGAKFGLTRALINIFSLRCPGHPHLLIFVW